MAESGEQAELKKPLIDGSVVNQVVTLYLFGIYTLRRGRLSPPDSMEKVLQMTRFVDRVGRISRRMKNAARGIRRSA